MTSQPPVKFNVRINQYRYGYADLQRVWLEADRLGYYSASLFDLLNTDALECWTTLTALLAQTQSIRAVPMVLANPYRHPALLAKMAATLDVISGGRITLGIGAGGSGSDTRASGLPWASTRQRCAMLEESVSLIRRLWTEPSVDFEGGFYRVAGASIQPKPVQQPTPPILVGGHGRRYVLPAIGRSGDIANVGNNDTLDDHRRHQGIVHRAAEAAGRDPSAIEWTHNGDCVIAATQREYDALVARLAERAGMPVAEYRARRLHNTLSGTPEQVAERISEYVEFGIRYFFVVFPDPAPSETLGLFAEEVMARFN
ncbi:MAG: LLM class flavin-dependent oxidoreductase [Chloroflexi bacterium]|nr:LLM class flavin-dependent oxidoreductase [Chloroflexota bacterium]MYD46975.1 LLM class flavin-dependent oxidoreductase [Chloroflexota bacterium]